MSGLKFVPESGEKPLVYDCGDGAVMQLYRNIGSEEFERFAEKMTYNGFSVYEKNVIADNVHYTFINDKNIVQLYRNDSTADVRVITDTNTTTYNKESSGQQKCKTELYQFETDHSLIDCGMCYIFKCCDGSFFIIDSAHFYSLRDNDRLHDFLRERTPEHEKIRISGWFISHAHVDHIAKFMDYIKYNMDDSIIDCIYMNIVSEEHKDNGSWSESDMKYIKNLRSLISESGIPTVKLHTGQKFFIKNLEFNVLCTHEDVFPQSNDNFNDSSTVLMVNACGTKILFPGDAGAEESSILERRYRENLKCDIVQLSHHGHFGTSSEFYTLAGAKTVLCPNTQIKFDEIIHVQKPNETAFSIADEFYISANGTVKLEMPYKPGTAEIFPDETTENFSGIKELWGYEYSDEFMQRHNEEFLRRKKRI